ncbi:MAG: hypothetical protein V1723_01915 [Candidatus Uhrbacteria bacterium]
MADTRQRDVVLAPNQFVYILDRTTGQVNVYRGPYKEAISADFRPVRWSGRQFVETDDFEAAICESVRVGESQYVVLQNPAKDPKRDMTAGKNAAIPLEAGKAVVLHGPTEFPLWPGQDAEVIDGHQLDEDQYLRCRVTGPISTDDAKGLWPVAKEDWRETPRPMVAARIRDPIEIETGVGAPGEGAPPTSVVPTPPAPKADDDPSTHFRIGFEFIVSGAKTRFFIPPTGVTVCAVESATTASTPATDHAAAARTAAAQQAKFYERFAALVAQPSHATTYATMARAAVARGVFDANIAKQVIDRLIGTDVTELRSDPKLRTIIESALRVTEESGLDFPSFAADVARAAQETTETLRRDARTETVEKKPVARTTQSYKRRGVRLAANEYVVLVNRVGRVSFVPGPTTVIPCIDQEFRLNSKAQSPVFTATPIDVNSGVLLQTLAPMTATEIRRRVPGVQLTEGAKDDERLPPGTQLVVWKQERLVFPADGIEVVSRFEATHILAGTARYVRNLTTGKTRIVKGEQLYLPDPRVEEFSERGLTDRERGLWFPNGDYNPELVPCITVPQGTAAMVLGVGKDGTVTRKVLVGHAVHFLEWDESLAVVRVSGSDRGEEKTWKKGKEICFLWTIGNRVNDVGKGLRSKDDCEFSIEYTLTVDFDQAQSDSWFTVDDYVFLVCDEVRSRLLGEMLRHPIHEIGTNYVDLVRDAILGRKEEGKPRPGLAFPRCGARLVDINVRKFALTDPQLQGQLNELQRTGVTESITTRRARLQLEAERERADIERQKAEAAGTLAQAKKATAVAQATATEEQTRDTEKLKAETEEKRITRDQEIKKKRIAADKEKITLEHENAKLEQEQKAALALAEADSREKVAGIDVKVAELKAKGALEDLKPDIERAKESVKRTIEQLQAEAGAQAQVLTAVLPQFAADIRLLTSVEAAKPVIEALGQAASLKGMEVTELLAQLAGGTPVISQFVGSLKEIAARIGRGDAATKGASVASSDPATK